MRPILMFLAALAAPGPLVAQDLPEPDAVVSAARDAAERLRDLAEDRLTLADMLGAEVIGADGTPIGTVEDFVALPGGNLVAAIVAREGGGRIALPWDAVQAGVAAGTGIELPMTEAELDGAEAIRGLNAALGL
jgi:hypothetical protein